MPCTQPISISRRNALVEENQDLVRSIARAIHRNLPPSFELDDLVQSGLIGLIQAAERFDPTVDFSFATFARHRVRGAILDASRRREYRHSTCEELPEDLPAANPDIEEHIAEKEVARQVAAAVDELPDRERRIVAMRYAEGVAPFTAIGAALAISKTRAIQLHRRALGRLQVSLKAA